MIEYPRRLVFLWTAFVVLAAVGEAQVANVSGFCAAETRFTVFNESSGFEEAVDFCAAQNSTLARIGNTNEHLRVVDLAVGQRLRQKNFWIGNFHIHLAIITMTSRICYNFELS